MKIKGESIEEKIIDYLEGIRAYCHGRDNEVIYLMTTNDFSFELSDKDAQYFIEQELSKFLLSTRQYVKHIEIQSLINLLKDFILSVDNRVLINENYIPRGMDFSNKEYINTMYTLSSGLFDHVQRLYNMVDKEIDVRGARGLIKRQSKHCIDVVPEYTVALLEELLKNPQRIKALTKESKARILSKFTGFNKKSCQNWLSKPINKYEKDAIDFINDLKKLD